jgi:hypothetical protein
VTSEHLVKIHVERIKVVNPAINAVVKDRFAEALREAKEKDDYIASAGADVGSLPPFFGVPCTIKECFAVAGMPNTSGLHSRRGIVASEDAPCVAYMRKVRKGERERENFTVDWTDDVRCAWHAFFANHLLRRALSSSVSQTPVSSACGGRATIASTAAQATRTTTAT